jgi:hypothetical protein
VSDDSELREALLGTWRLVSVQDDADGTIVKPFGDDPVGYLIYTSDDHVVVQYAARERGELFRQSAHGPVLLETAEASSPLGFRCYCGTFEVRDGQVIHHTEFDLLPRLNHRVEARSALLDGDRLTVGTPGGRQLEWQRVHSAEEAR